MHKYRQIEYKAGATLEVIRCIPRELRDSTWHQKVKKSKEDINQANMRQAARKLARKINANFRPGDLHVTLTYKRAERPEPEEAQKLAKNLLDDLRKKYKKAGKLLKYVLVTEYKNKSIHHHLIINNINDGKHTTTDYIRTRWKRGNQRYVPLYNDSEYEQLAEYLIKETEKTFRDKDSPFRQRYSCSRNLIDPKPVTKTKKVKKGWDLDPKPRPGYYIKKGSLYNGFDKMGFPYQRYILIKENPVFSDWASDDWIPRKRRIKHEQRNDTGKNPQR